MGIFIRWTRLDWSGLDWSTSCTQTIKVSFKKGGYLWVLNWLHLYQLSLICIHWVLSVGKQTSSVFNWALNRMFFFSSLKNRRAFFGGSNFIHADLEMTQDSFGVILFCWLYVAVWSALSQSNWAQSTPIQWIEMPICYKPTRTLKAKRPTSQNWGNTPLEAEDILHTSLPMSPPSQQNNPVCILELDSINNYALLLYKVCTGFDPVLLHQPFITS